MASLRATLRHRPPLRLAPPPARSAPAGSSRRLAHRDAASSSVSSADAARDDGAAVEQPLTGAAKLLADAILEEAAEERAEALKEAARRGLDQGPVWTGDERVQDAVLRMLVDKHKPLRVKPSGTAHPADAKLATVQQPTAAVPSVASGSGSGMSALLDSLPPPGEDGRRLPATPANRPWLAEYVNPAYIGRVQGDDSSGKIYRGRHLAAGALAGSRSKKLDASSVPWDDPRAMRRLRDSTKRAEQTGRMVRARVGALDYRLGLRQPRDNRSEKEKQEELVYAGGGTGYSSLANERIQEAMRSGAFRNNSLRGSKLQTLDEESNPYLSREERLMNRLVKRQGAAPPFVELNSELEAAHTGFRAKLIDAWVRRASRMLLADTSLNHLSAPGIDDVALEAALQELARTHRDVEWERAERAFHEVSVKEVNNAVRKYNGIAPFHARRALITVEAELQRALTNAAPALV
ncbi:hypothetical protein FA09DRAFT_310877, partial [Tilletiopsis washingtonensis]